MNDTLDLLRRHNLKTPVWSLQGRNLWCRVVDAYDADTLTMILPLATGCYRFSCRIYGIDTAEMKSKLAENKNASLRARNRMLQLCGVPNVQLDRAYTRKEVQAMLDNDAYVIWAKCGEFDKYGRLLCEVFRTDNDPRSLGDILIEEKLAYPYFGETKMTESQQVASLQHL